MIVCDVLFGFLVSRGGVLDFKYPSSIESIGNVVGLKSRFPKMDTGLYL